MASELYAGADGLARRATEVYVGVGGVARRVTLAYAGVNGLARLCYSARVTGNPFSVTFRTLDAARVTGTWNEGLARIEF